MPQNGPLLARPSAPLGSDSLTTEVYRQLRAIAKRKLAYQPAGHTLQATALVHEAFLKLRNHSSIIAAEPSRFYRAAAQAMRQVLVDHARARGCQRRGGRAHREFADVAELAESQDPAEILALDEAISQLEAADPQAAQVVQLRFFCGMSVEETASTMGLSPRTIKREWQYARARLFEAMR